VRSELLIATLILCRFALAGPSTIAAECRIEMELVSEPGLPAGAAHEWLRTLTARGVDKLRIRAAEPGAEPRIETAGPRGAPVYRVTGVLTASNMLQVPGRIFSARDSAGLAVWLKQLRELGPNPPEPAERLPWGFTSEQLAEVRTALADPVGWTTRGVERREALEQLIAQTRLSVTADRVVFTTIASSDRVREELANVAIGTALASVLRSSGCGFEPRLAPSGAFSLVVQSVAELDEPWPVGWPIEGTDRDIVPKLFEFLPASVENASVAQGVEAVAERLGAPVLWDSLALVRFETDIDATKISIEPRRMAYFSLLRRLLAPVWLDYHVRLDEANHPFLWIASTRKP